MPTDLDAIPNHLFLNANLDGGVLPSDPKQLYNALTAVKSPLELDLRPDTDDPNFPKIVVMGIRTSIHFVTVEELGAATFIFLVEQLLITRDAVHTLLGGGDYQDHWREDWDYWKD